MIRNILLLSLVVVSVMAESKAPTPFCVAKPIIQEAPLALHQTLKVDLDDYFSGYNLNFKLASNNSFATIKNRLTEIDRRNVYLPNIITHYVEHDGNDWGHDAFILYLDNSGSVVFTYGKITDQTHIPDLSQSVIVTTDKNIKCFGAALLLQFGLGIVDCMKLTQKPQTPFQNYFYYVDLANKNVTKIVKNSLFVKYTQITKRKTLKYKDINTGYQYLLRVYPADGVNHEARGNTYMQIFSVRDPYDIQIMKVIDRTYIHTTTLSITDAKVYLGDIFFLDYLHGLYRLDILHNNDVLITGRYAKDGFTKFAVYSDDLQNQVLIALSNNHAVHEVDWSDIRDPVLVCKYSLMADSRVKQLLINDLFVVVQSQANATNSTHTNFTIDYTWVFSRGSRTYSNAYAVINHNSSKVELEFNRGNDRLLYADQGGLALFQMNEPILYLTLGETGKVGTSEEVVVIADSTDPFSKQSIKCQVRSKINFVKGEDQTIYQQNYHTTTVYSSNNPGELHINLDHYVLGPNLTYSLINQTAKHEIPTHWVNKLNLTRVLLDTDIGDVIFFHTQVIPMFGQDRIIYYAQDSRHRTHVIECIHIWEDSTVRCTEQANYTHTADIQAFTTAFFKDQEGFNYFYIMVFKDDLKTLRIVDYTRHKYLMNITYVGHKQAQITDIATSNGYLYVLRGAVKTIDVYKLKDCQEQQKCNVEFRIDAESLKPLGIHYFAPQKIVTEFPHPEVLFIKCKGSVLILDIDNKDEVTVLDEIISSESTMSPHFRIAVNKDKLIIVSEPDIIDLYTLDHIYIKHEVKYVKRLPVFGYKIQAVSDIEYSDENDLIYVNAVDPDTNKSIILIYKTNMPAATSLYATIPLRKLYSRPGLEIEVSGFYVDFLNIKTDDGFTLYRVWSVPQYVIKDVYLDFKFQIQFKNTQTKLQSALTQVESVNYPSGFDPTPELNKTLNSLKIQTTGHYTWDDRKWFVGHILGYNFTCDQCGQEEDSKIHLKQHIDPMRNLQITSYDYAQTLSGGVSVHDDLFRWRINGSIHDVINLPDQKYLQRCVRVATAFHTDLIVTACQQLGRGINLYVTTQTCDKPWTWGPYRSTAYNVRKMQVAGDILMVVDSSVYPEYKFESGAVFLYDIFLDNISGEEMNELEVIDANDLAMAHGYDKEEVYIGNAHLVFTSINDCYRLYVTEVDGGLFVVDFQHHIARRQINILTINFVDMKKMLQEHELHMPSDASFQAVSLISYKYNPHFYMQSVIVTTKKYHNLQVTLVYDDDGNIIKPVLHRIYYRYGYYETINEVRSVYGYLAISYIIPYTQQYMSNNTRQIVAVYDTSDYDDDHEKGYSERYMLGAVRHNNTAPLMFAFNTTYDARTNGTRIGLVVTNPFDSTHKNMQELSLSKNLSLELKGNYKTQTLTIIPYSDFDMKTFQVQVFKKNDDDDKAETIMTIIIIILAVLITLGFAIYIFILLRNKREKNQEERASLLTEGETTRNSLAVEPKAGEYLPPGQVGNQEESDEEESDEDIQEVQVKSPPKVEKKQPVSVPVVVPTPTKTEERPKSQPVEQKKLQPQPVEEKKLQTQSVQQENKEPVIEQKKLEQPPKQEEPKPEKPAEQKKQEVLQPEEPPKAEEPKGQN